MKTIRMLQLATLTLTMAAAAGAAQPAHAQTGFFFPNGDSMWLHESRMQPGANVGIPGTSHYWRDPVTGAQGRRYLGLDGRWHGETQFTNPNGTQQTHVYSGQSHGNRANNGGYRPSGSVGGSRPFGHNPYGMGAPAPGYRSNHGPGHGSSFRHR